MVVENKLLREKLDVAVSALEKIANECVACKNDNVMNYESSQDECVGDGCNIFISKYALSKIESLNGKDA
jgi:hypothetical protein